MAVAATLGLAGCGATSEPTVRERPQAADRDGAAIGTPSQARARDACALAEPETVASLFGAGTSTEGPGPFPGTCSYEPDGGVSPHVIVADLGPAWTWQRLRRYYAQTRQGLADAARPGRAAFTAADARSVEIIVRMRRRIFTVVAELGTDREGAGDAVGRLARQVAREFPARIPPARN